MDFKNLAHQSRGGPLLLLLLLLLGSTCAFSAQRLFQDRAEVRMDPLPPHASHWVPNDRDQLPGRIVFPNVAIEEDRYGLE